MTSNLFIKSIIIYSLYWGLGLMWGCKKKEDCDEKQVFKTYKCYKVKVENNKYEFNNGKVVSYFNTYEDTVHSLEYGFSLVFDVEKFAEKKTNSNPFFTNAYAGICTEYNMEITDRIQSVKIYTVNYFNEAFPAGSLITTEFLYLDPKRTGLADKQLSSVDSIIKDDNLYRIEEFSYGLITPLYLKIIPSQDTKVQFRIDLVFESGNKMSTYTRELFLKK